MKKMGKVTRLIVALLTFTLLFELFPIGSENNLNKVQAATTLNNPRTVADSFMNAKQKVTWDCVWFGAYPQSEVTSGDIYNKLKNATGWDENNDIVIDGNKYRRLKGEDATYYNTKRVLNYYDWIEDYSTYHYFKYEAIKWRVLNVSNGGALLLADQALDSQRYNQNSEDITWEKSSIRSWLNAQDTINNQEGINYRKGNFLNEAFFLSEQAGILPRNIANKNNATYNTSGGNNTLDKIFLLAETQICGLDAKKYGFIMDHSIDDEARQSKCAEYAFAMGCYKFVETKYAENVNWWLRSPGGSSKAALKIDYDYCKKVIDSVFRMMKELDIFDGEISPTKKTVIVKKNDMEVVHCNTSGIFIPKTQIGSYVREGQVIGSIVRPILGAEIEEIIVPCDGMIFSLREYPAVCEGELLARICKTERPAGKYE